MLRVEFHAHTRHSKDSLATPQAILQACRRKGIDRLIVTDHNAIAGAQELQNLDPGRVIVGEEIMTRQGELLAAYVRERVPPGLAAEEAIAALRAQGAFISVSHPFDVGRGWSRAELEAITPLVDAIEGFNARCVRAEWNDQAHAYAQAHGLLETVGSDAHHPDELGRATLLLPEFDDATSLKAALAHAEPRLRLSSPLVHLYSRWAVWFKLVRGEERKRA